VAGWAPRTLVVGGSRGIGRATVLRLAAAGASTAIAYRRDTEGAQETAKEAAARGGLAVLLQGDVATDAASLVEEAAERLGGLDFVVVTAVPVITGRMGAVSAEEFHRAMDVVVWGFTRTVLAARPHLSRSGGSAVAVSSLGSWLYASYYGALGPAKAALESSVRYLAAELGRDGVRVNAVSPCLVDDAQHVADAPEVAAFFEATAKRTPLRRLATPDDVAGVIVGLGSPDFGLVTGEVVRVDGGYRLLA
jgi:NAD(P)-dependent dehydrogenase (short-subunit alcohol dehydrogenase family)